MSLKATAYHIANPSPKNTNRFIVMLPNCPWSVMRVSSASFPYATHNVGNITWFGRKFELPTDIDVSGSWTCTYDEDIVLSGGLTISRLDRYIRFSKFKDTQLLIYMTDDITGMIPMNCCTLNNVFLEKVEPLKLNWQGHDIVRWTLTFHYTSFKRWI